MGFGVWDTELHGLCPDCAPFRGWPSGSWGGDGLRGVMWGNSSLQLPRGAPHLPIYLPEELSSLKHYLPALICPLSPSPSGAPLPVPLYPSHAPWLPQLPWLLMCLPWGRERQ